MHWRIRQRQRMDQSVLRKQTQGSIVGLLDFARVSRRTVRLQTGDRPQRIDQRADGLIAFSRQMRTDPLRQCLRWQPFVEQIALQLDQRTRDRGVTAVERRNLGGQGIAHDHLACRQYLAQRAEVPDLANGPA